jgi:hypothetical protein
MIALTLSLTLAALPCNDLGGLRTRLGQAAASAKWADALAELELKSAPVPISPPKALAPADAARWVADRAGAVCGARELARPDVTVDRARLGSILARPEFTHESTRGRALSQWLSRLADWLLHLLQSDSARGYAEWTRSAVLAVALLVVAFGLARLTRVRRRKARAAASSAPSGFTLAPAADHLALARSSLSTDARTAIRHGWLALLSALERRRLARPDRVKTNREIVADLPARGASTTLVERVSPLVEWFDLRFYSLAPVAMDEAAGFLDRVASLASELAEAP